MARFFKESGPSLTFTGPTDGLGKAPPINVVKGTQQEPEKKEQPKKEQPKQQQAAESKGPDREAQAQEPIRKSEGGRYDDADGYDELRR